MFFFPELETKKCGAGASDSIFPSFSRSRSLSRVLPVIRLLPPPPEEVPFLTLSNKKISPEIMCRLFFSAVLLRVANTPIFAPRGCERNGPFFKVCRKIMKCSDGETQRERVGRERELRKPRFSPSPLPARNSNGGYANDIENWIRTQLLRVRSTRGNPADAGRGVHPAVRSPPRAERNHRDRGPRIAVDDARTSAHRQCR